ncbi:transcriptional repressor [Candidatus Bathyarchaeota archaeon]|nr:transcriptional repressor [Candidatus Bathyarchaeota archaeon]
MEINQIIAKFHEKGFKATPQRLAICKYVLLSKDHPTTDMIYNEVKQEYPTISLATVYQTLHLLSDIGLLQELDSNNGISRYDPKTSPHINIICKKCGKVEDYESERLEKFWSKIVDDLGFKPLGQRIDVYRYCEDCRRSRVK